MTHYIGEYYKYNNSKKLYRLKQKDGYMYRFYGGHSITDTVFKNMVRVKTNEPNFKYEQTKLF